MSRHTRTQGTDVTFVIVVLVGAAAWTHRAVLEHIAFIALAILGCAIVLRIAAGSILHIVEARGSGV